MAQKIRVLIVDDSIFFRTAMSRSLTNCPDIQVIDTARDAAEAEKIIVESHPDVITLDIEMPGMRGIDFMKKIMPVHPIRVVLVSSLSVNVFEVLEAGAIDFVKKPDMRDPAAFGNFSRELQSKIRIAAKANLCKQGGPCPKEVAAAPVRLTARLSASAGDLVVAIGASTGGTEAILEVIRDLPVNFFPIVITQHMPPVFTRMFAERLNKTCQIEVYEAENGNRLRPGVAYIAPGDRQMMLHKDSGGYFVRCVEGPKVSGHCPSVDVLFESVSKAAGAKAIGVILTGMGRDGAKGLLSMHENGAFTIGQDQNSCVVYGMPMEAFHLGAVDKQAPLKEIASILMNKAFVK